MKLFINRLEWTIKFVPSGDDILRRLDGTLSIGACDKDLQTIFIDETLTGWLLKKVLCHELMHAAMFSYDIQLSFEQEELLADLVATYGEEFIEITNKIFQKLKEGYS